MDFIQDTSNLPYANNTSPKDECLFDSSLMTEDAWKVLSMIEYANNACSQEYLGYDFESSTDYFTSKIKAEAAEKNAKPKIWSIEDIIGGSDKKKRNSAFNKPAKITSYYSYHHDYPSSEHSTDANSVVLSDYGYLDSYSHGQQQLDSHLMPRYGLDVPMYELLCQTIVDGHCCKYVEQLFQHGRYYQCAYCYQSFSNINQLCQHQIAEHPLIS